MYLSKIDLRSRYHELKIRESYMSNTKHFIQCEEGFLPRGVFISKFEEGLPLEIKEKMSITRSQSYKKVVQ